MLGTYVAILLYFVIATLYPIDKIIGKFYPVLGLMLILGTGMVLVGFIINGVNLQDLTLQILIFTPIIYR